MSQTSEPSHADEADRSAVNARVVTFYLPQFHPIPENDEWWEPGFTEWTNVTRARPLYPGHQQPMLPSELGFYDLRVPETRRAQGELASTYGVEAFCYWHYWFGDGRRLLERPFTEVLASGEPSISFCVAWANETWSGAWIGAPDKVLQQQTYPGEADDRAHFAALLPAFRDDRYLTVDGRPVFYVYRPSELPDAAAFVDRWQAMAAAAGLPGLYLVAEVSDGLGTGPPAKWTGTVGFDAVAYLRLPLDVKALALLRRGRVRRALRLPGLYRYATGRVRELDGDRPVQPVIYPNWDNTPRMGRDGLVLVGATPERFEENVRDAVALVASRPPSERFVWIKSWNEWAEGNHLEPDQVFGRGWLESLRRGLG
jgi:lipopolysaccharide biosynthesis protein